MTALDLALKLQQLLNGPRRPGNKHHARAIAAELVELLKSEKDAMFQRKENNDG